MLLESVTIPLMKFYVTDESMEVYIWNSCARENNKNFCPGKLQWVNNQSAKDPGRKNTLQDCGGGGGTHIYYCTNSRTKKCVTVECITHILYLGVRKSDC